MNDLALKVLFDLEEMGVNLEKVVLTSLQDGTSVKLDFPWRYHGTSLLRKRSITFLNGDITKPDSYSMPLKSILADQIDIFYMKGAFLAPKYYPQFLPHIARCVNPNGWLMTADKTFTMEAISPEPCLKESQLTFATHKTDEVRMVEELMLHPVDPLATFATLRLLPPERRAERSSGSDLTYWTILNLRQKK